MNFELFRSGGETFKMRFYVGHDGTMIRLISALGLGETAQLRWPSLGSELVMEVRCTPITQKMSADVENVGVGIPWEQVCQGHS